MDVHVDVLEAPLPASGAPSLASSTATVTPEERKYEYQHVDDDDETDAQEAKLSVNPNLPEKNKKEMNSTNATENWRMILMARNQFTKHGRYGKPKVRKIVVNCTTGDVAWNGESKGLNVRNLVGVSFGKDAKPLQRDWAYDADATLCFTLHFLSRDVCLQASTVHQAESFIEALNAFAEYLKTSKRASSKYRRGLKKGASTPDVKSTAAAPIAGSSGASTQNGGRGKAVMDVLPDRAMSKHMQHVRRAGSQKNLR